MATTVYICQECRKFFSNFEAMVNHECSGVAVSTNQPCQPLKSPERQLQKDNEDKAGPSLESQSQWTRQPTLLLIDEYQKNKQKMDEGKLKKNSFWAHVTKKLQEEGYHFTEEQVNGRWKTLSRNYKAVKDGNKKSGNGRKDFSYFDEMERIYGNDPAIKPKATLSSVTAYGNDPAIKPKAKLSSVKANPTCSSASATADPDDDDDDGISNPPAKKTCRKKSSEVLEFLESVVEKQEQRYQKEQEEKKKMHNERMDIMRKFLEKLN